MDDVGGFHLFPESRGKRASGDRKIFNNNLKLTQNREGSKKKTVEKFRDTDGHLNMPSTFCSWRKWKIPTTGPKGSLVGQVSATPLEKF